MLHSFLRSSLIAAAGFFLTACLLSDSHRKAGPPPGGHVSLTLSLERPRSMLLKSAADTTFGLDSLIVVFTAPQADTFEYRVALAGRADTGNIALPPLVFELVALRNWKATIYSIDEIDSLSRDTVHLDSVVFAVRPADTTAVAKTISPAFSILRARFVSAEADSIPDNVIYVRLRVNGVTRDSAILGGKNATLRWLQTLPGSVIFAAGDSGRILKSTNDAQTSDSGAWVETVVSTERLVGGHFPNATTGYVVSISGKFFATVNGGTSWTQRNGSNPPDSLNAVWFTSDQVGFAVGRHGGLYKTPDGGYSWYARTHMVSNTVQNLNGVHFPTADIGFVVGENETILRTLNGTAGATPPPGGVIWTPVAGGWFPQYPGTTKRLNDIKFANQDTGWAVGADGTLLVTYNRGAGWEARSASDLSSRNVNALWITGNHTQAYAVADGGRIVRMNGHEYTWQAGLAGPSGTTENLYDVRFVGADTGYVVGANGVIRRTVNGTSNVWNGVVWAAQSLPALDPAWSSQSIGSFDLNAVHLVGQSGWAVGGDGKVSRTTNGGATWSAPQSFAGAKTLRAVHFVDNDSGWAVGDSETVVRTTNGGTNWSVLSHGWETLSGGFGGDLHAVRFADASTGWAVGDSGKILKTTDGGAHWAAQANEKTKPLRGLHALTTSVAVAVGDSGIVKRTVDGGATWSTHASGVTTRLNAVVFASASLGWAVGESSVILRTNDSGKTWDSRAGGTGNYNAAYVGNHVWVVGDGGQIRRSNNINYSASFSTAPSGAIGATDLHGVHFTSRNTGYVVGDGGLIARTTNGGGGVNNVTWTVQTPVSEDLRHVYFYDANNGYVVGAQGTVLKTTDAGATWKVLASGTSAALASVHAPAENVLYVAGASGTLLKSVSGGQSISGRESPQSFRAVTHYSASVAFVAGDSGIILRTTNGGAAWQPMNTGTTRRLNGIFSNGSRVWAVGDGGTFLRATSNLASGTPAWTEPTNPFGSRRLNAVHFTSSNIGIVVGDSGYISKCTNSANNSWATKGTGLTNDDLLAIRFVDANTGYVTGRNGTILKTTNAGENWTVLSPGSDADLRGVHPVSADNVVAVGTDGTVLYALAGGDTPSSFLRSLRSVFPVTSSLVYVAGDFGTIARTTNAGVTWTHQESGVDASLNGIGFANANTGWAVGSSGTILRTTDGGANWEAQSSGTSKHLRSVFVRSMDTVYATGESGIILKTVNGGDTWYEQESPTSEALSRVYFYNAAVGFAVGNNGAIVNAVNQGDNWTGGGVKRSLKGVYFVSPSTGWIVGNDGVILKTTDTGKTWIEQHRQDSLQLYGIQFLDANTGWVTGEGGVILKTTNGGATWVPQNSNTNIDLQWVNFRDANRGFVIGGTESILETTNGGATWSGLFVGVPGERQFDRLLTYKRLRPGVPQQVILDAMERFNPPLRGFQAVLDLTVGAGVDSTINVRMSRCGHVDSLPCVP